MSHYLPLYLPYALNTFSQHADKMLPYLNQSSVKVPSSDSMETVARNLGSYGAKLVNRFWQSVYFKPQPFKRDPNAGSSFFTDNYLRCVNNDYNQELGTVKVEDGIANMFVILPMTIGNQFVDGRGEVSAFALTPWIVQDAFREAYIEAILTYYPVQSAEQYEEMKAYMLANTQLFALAGCATGQVAGFHSLRSSSLYKDHVFASPEQNSKAMLQLFSSAICEKIVAGSAEAINTVLPPARENDDLIDALRSSLFNFAEKPAHVEKAIVNFVEKRAYSVACPIFGRGVQSDVVCQTAFTAFKQIMKTKFTDSELSRIFFQAGGSRFEIGEFEKVLQSIVLNLVWMGKNQEDQPTIYPSFVQKMVSCQMMSAYRSTDVSIVAQSQNYDSNMNLKNLEFMNPFSVNLDIGLAYKVKIAEFFKADPASEV